MDISYDISTSNKAAAAPAKTAKTAPASATATATTTAPASATASSTTSSTTTPLKKTVVSKKPTAKKVPTQVFTIDATEPAADEIFDIASFEKFLHDRIKIDGKTGVLGELITITRDGNIITVTSKTHISKRYLKYLTKKFLKKQLLRDYIRVIARTKNGYFLRYFNFQNEEEETEE